MKTKTKTKMLKKLLLISAVVLASNHLIAQSLPSSTTSQNICIGIEDYEIVPSPNSTYSWSIIDQATGVAPASGVADITSVTSDWYIQVNFTIPGMYVLSVEELDVNLCQGESVDLNITVSPLDDATFTLTDYCEGSTNSATVTGTLGGLFTFTSPAPTSGEMIDPSTGEITGGLAGTTYSVTYTTTGICPQSSTETVTVSPLDDATFTLTDYCEGSTNSATVTGTLGGLFTFTSPAPTSGEMIDPSTGEITGGLAGTTYSVTYTTTGICPQSSTETVTVSPLDDATFTLTDYCEGSTNSATVTGTLGGLFTFTSPAPTSGEMIDPLTGEITSGVGGTTYSVTYTTTGICPQSSTETVIINPIPTPGPIWHN